MKKLILITLIGLMTGALFGQSYFPKGIYIGSKYPVSPGSNIVLFDSTVYSGGILEFYNGSSSLNTLNINSYSISNPNNGENDYFVYYDDVSAAYRRVLFSDVVSPINGLTLIGTHDFGIGGPLTQSTTLTGAYLFKVQQNSGTSLNNSITVNSVSSNLTSFKDATNYSSISTNSSVGGLTISRQIAGTDYFVYMDAGGLYYAGDYSGSYTDRHLVDRGYVSGLYAPLNSPTFTGSPTVPGYVPTSTTVNAHALTGNISVTASDVGLGNVTNESKATMFTSPTFTGTATIPTPFTLGAVSVTTTGTELNYVSGVTSAIQTQLGTKLNTADSTGISPGNYVTHTQLYDTVSATDYFVLSHPDTLAVTADYTLVLTDDGKRIRANKATSMTVTLPPNASVAFTKEATIYVQQLGAGPIVFKAGSGVTIYSELDSIALNTQYRWAAVIYWGNNNYQLIGTKD